MLVAAKTMALTVVDLFSNQELIAEAQQEHVRRIGPDFVYTPLVGDRDPPLDYRKPAGQR
jgi:aminobenzoyl-glutamate utilization protein B